MTFPPRHNSWPGILRILARSLWVKSGRDDVEEDLKPGYSTTSKNDENIQNMNEMVYSDCGMIVRIMAEELGLGRTILMEDLGIKKICTKMVPKLLSDDQKGELVLGCFGASRGQPRVPGRCHHWRQDLGLLV